MKACTKRCNPVDPPKHRKEPTEVGHKKIGVSGVFFAYMGNSEAQWISMRKKGERPGLNGLEFVTPVLDVLQLQEVGSGSPADSHVGLLKGQMKRSAIKTCCFSAENVAMNTGVPLNKTIRDDGLCGSFPC